MNPQPCVSVCIAAYNSAKYIDQCLGSISSQTLRDLEIVVADDASRDRTAEVVASFADPRVKLVRNEKNLGAPATYNRAVAYARGKYVVMFPSDDEMLPTNLQEKFEMLEQRPELGFVYSDSYMTDASGTITGTYWAREGYRPVRGKLNADLLTTVGMIVCGHTPLIRRAVLEHVGGFDPRLKHAHDGDLWLRIAAEYPIDFIPKPLVKWRLHGANSHGRGDPVEYLDRVEVLERMTREHPGLITEQMKQVMLASYIALAGLQIAPRNRSGARPSFRRALQLCPYHLPALLWYANSFVGIPALWDFQVYKRLWLKLRAFKTSVRLRNVTHKSQVESHESTRVAME